MSFKPIGPLPHLREGRRTIPKEATLFEYLKSINFAENLRLELTTQNIDQYIDVNYFGHVYEDNLDEIRLDTLSSVIDDVVSLTSSEPGDCLSSTSMCPRGEIRFRSIISLPPD